MNNKWQKYIAGGFILMVVLLILTKLIYNHQANKLQWTDEDAKVLTEDCINDLAAQGYAIRFPKQTQSYCECSTQALVENLKKADYLLLKQEGGEKEQDVLLRLVLDCYNDYQEAMYNASNLD